MDEPMPIVIDNGSGSVKAGFSGEEAPRVLCPSMVGRPKGSGVIGGQQKSEYIGEEAQKLRSVLNLSYPIKGGIVESWEDMEKLWNYLFYCELRVDPCECQVMLTDTSRTPKANREKMVEVMFETFGVRSMYAANQSVMALYANGRTTGVAVNSGDGLTEVVPVLEGFSIPHAVEQSRLAGRQLTEHMVKLLYGDGIEQRGSEGQWSLQVREMKERLGYVAAHYEDELHKAAESRDVEETYSLPDKEQITVNMPRFSVPEALFKPDLIGEGADGKGLHKLVNDAVKACDIDVRKDLYKNIILSGGSTMFPGLPDRLEQEVDALCCGQGVVRVIAAQDRLYSVWKGGSTLTSLSTFASSWVTRDDYEEHGSSVVHRKCQ